MDAFLRISSACGFTQAEPTQEHAGVAHLRAGRVRSYRSRRLAALAFGLCLMAGCSGGRSILVGGPTVGQLKTSLSRVEYENNELESRVARLERDNRALENRLSQEQLDNGELAARLDDARNLLRDRGVEFDTRLSAKTSPDNPEDEDEASAHPRRARSASRPRRKVPLARIPGPEDTTSSDPESRGDSPDAETGASARLDARRLRSHGNPNRWARAEDSDLTTVIR